jgi:hypothetical protein
VGVSFSRKTHRRGEPDDDHDRKAVAVRRPRLTRWRCVAARCHGDPRDVRIAVDLTWTDIYLTFAIFTVRAALRLRLAADREGRARWRRRARRLLMSPTCGITCASMA